MLLVKAFKEKPESLTRALEDSDSQLEMALGRSRTNIFSTIPEARSEIKLTTLSEMNLQAKKDQVKVKDHLLPDSDMDDCLQFPYGQIFATVLEDAIIEFRILGEDNFPAFDQCNNYLRLAKTIVELPILKGEKFGLSEPVGPKDELSEIDPDNLHCIEYKLQKLCNDRTMFDDLLNRLYIELSTKRCFYELDNHVSNILEKQEYYSYLLEAEAKNKNLIKELHKQLRQQRNNIKRTQYEADVMIVELRRRMEDAYLAIEIRSRHVENWQRARTEQHIIKTNQKESIYIDSANYYKIRTDGEQRVHAEIDVLIYHTISETLIRIEEWMTKYDTDMEAIELKIQIKRNEYELKKEKRIGLEQKIALHNKQMWDWNRFKDERARLKLYNDTMLKSALIVQAWWRGILVRKQLGPFRQKKKPKKPKN